MEFKNSRTAELFEAAVASGDNESVILVVVVSQVALIACLPIPFKDKTRLTDGLGLIIDGLSPGFMERNRDKAQNIGEQMDADRIDVLSGR